MQFLTFLLRGHEGSITGTVRNSPGLSCAVADLGRSMVTAFLVMAVIVVALLFLGRTMLAISLMRTPTARVMRSLRWDWNFFFLVFIYLLYSVINQLPVLF